MWKKNKTSCPPSPATCRPHCKLGMLCFRPGTGISCHHHFTSHPELMVTFPCTFQPSHAINFSPPKQDPNPLSAHPIPPVLLIPSWQLCCVLHACEPIEGVSAGSQFRRESTAGTGSVPLCHVTGWALWKSCTPAVVMPWIFLYSNPWCWLLSGSVWAMCQGSGAALGMRRAEMVPGWHLPCLRLENSVEWPPSTKMYH